MSRFNLLLVLLGYLIPGLVLAQQSQTPFSFEVTSVVHQQALQPHLRALSLELETVLKEKGGKAEEGESWLFVISGSEPNVEGDFALSVTILRKLPEELVQLGTEHEAFYVHATPEEKAAFPDEGAFVRRHMSESFMRGFASLHAKYVVIANQTTLRSELESIADQFLAPFSHN